MKLATLEHASQGRFVALLTEDASGYWPLQDLLPYFSGSMQTVLEQWPLLVPLLKPQQPAHAMRDVTVRAPHIPSRNLFCVGKNYAEHVLEFSQSGFDQRHASSDIPAAPIIFTKAPETVIATGTPIPRHANVTQQMDYEAELAVIIGKTGRHIAPEKAMDYVWGYTIANDITARDLQKTHQQWFLGKSLDGFCPLGPWLVSRDEIDLATTAIRCEVNGELRQNAALTSLIFNIPALISTISAGITLKPGDVILTGTPAGVGVGFTPPKFLQTGDQIDIEISGLGRLTNVVGD